MAGSTRWGILGTGAIAKKFVTGLGAVAGAECLAVGSRTAAGARSFGAENAVERCYGSYEELARDGDVDIVYVATPHSRHAADTILCLESGRHVLCEKPFAINHAQARTMVDCARAHDRFLMEALWTHFNPVAVHLRELLAEGAIGEPRLLAVDFGFRAEHDPEARLFNPELGGGALLDVGVYCVWLAHVVFGGPAPDVTGCAEIGTTGVDEQCAWVFRYANGALAHMSAAVRTDTPHEAVISGTRGRIRIPDFWHPSELAVDGETSRFDIAGNGYGYEAAEAMRCLAAGMRESEAWPLARTLELMADLDRIRALWGLRYPME